MQHGCMQDDAIFSFVLNLFSVIPLRDFLLSNLQLSATYLALALLHLIFGKGICDWIYWLGFVMSTDVDVSHSQFVEICSLSS